MSSELGAEQFSDANSVGIDAGGIVAGGGTTGDVDRPKRRGRPPKSESPAVERIDPATLGSGNGDASGSADAGTGSKRGRKPRAATEAPLSVDTLVMALSVAQLTLVQATGVPEFMLAPEQTKTLAEASARVARHFPAVVTQKQQDFINLALCVGSIGYAQFMAYSTRKAMEARAAKQGEPLTVNEAAFYGRVA